MIILTAIVIWWRLYFLYNNFHFHRKNSLQHFMYHGVTHLHVHTWPRSSCCDVDIALHITSYIAMCRIFRLIVQPKYTSLNHVVTPCSVVIGWIAAPRGAPRPIGEGPVQHAGVGGDSGPDGGPQPAACLPLPPAAPGPEGGVTGRFLRLRSWRY